MTSQSESKNYQHKLMIELDRRSTEEEFSPGLPNEHRKLFQEKATPAMPKVDLVDTMSSHENS